MRSVVRRLRDLSKGLHVNAVGIALRSRTDTANVAMGRGMSESYWRKQAAPIIAEVLKETAGQDEKAIREALKEVYPFGPRKYHPYVIWRDEVARQRGLKKRTAKQRQQERLLPPDPRQQEMF
jgi:hypothetical protein